MTHPPLSRNGSLGSRLVDINMAAKAERDRDHLLGIALERSWSWTLHELAIVHAFPL